MTHSGREGIVTPRLAPSIPEPEPKLEQFYVTLKQIWYKHGWKKVWNIDEENIVILGCTEKMTIDTFVAKCKEKKYYLPW